MGNATFSAGDLTAVIGDNSAEGEHRAGYNGLWSLRHATCVRSLFVPAYAGLNHEHIFNGDAEDDPEVFFEPRRAPLEFQRISDTEAQLHQPPTPTFELESWTRFTLVAPHYLDMTYRCVAHQHRFHRGYIGLFWASYIHGPEDKSMYFIGGRDGSKGLWTQLCTPMHNDESTVRHRSDPLKLDYQAGGRPTLFRSFSPLRFDEAFFYGLFENHVFMLMFDRSNGIRFSHSPEGGGGNPDRRTTNPAWDFQFIVPNYEVLKSYSFRARAVFRPRCSRLELVGEYETWRQAL